MLTETTVSKLREMRLSVMANALKDQLADPQFQNMAFEDRIGLLVDAEWNARKNNHLTKLIKGDTRLRHIPVVIFSSLIAEEMRRKGKEVGADEQLSKPEIGHLIGILDHLLKEKDKKQGGRGVK